MSSIVSSEVSSREGRGENRTLGTQNVAICKGTSFSCCAPKLRNAWGLSQGFYSRWGQLAHLTKLQLVTSEDVSWRCHKAVSVREAELR